MPPEPAPRERALAALVALLALALAAWVDHATGVEVASSIFYFVPIAIVTWWVGPGAGVATAALAAFTWFANDMLLGQNSYRSEATGYWNALVRLGVFLVVSTILARLRHTLRAMESHAEEVQSAYEALDRSRKEQLLLKDQLLSNVSHELRTPLTALHQFVSLVADGTAGEVNPVQREYLGVAMRNVDQLTRMISDLLDSSRVDTGKLRLESAAVRLHEVIEDICRILRSPAAERDVALACQAPPSLPAVRADPARLRQVLLNLIDNAVKFSPSGGTVVVRAAADGAQLARVSVVDSGPGIAPEAQAQLFGRLFQEDAAAEGTSRRGLGLGLFISKGIVERMGGRIWVESEPGRGSAFHFTVPLAETGKEAAMAEIDEHVGRS